MIAAGQRGTGFARGVERAELLSGRGSGVALELDWGGMETVDGAIFGAVFVVGQQGRVPAAWSRARRAELGFDLAGLVYSLLALWPVGVEGGNEPSVRVEHSACDQATAAAWAQQGLFRCRDVVDGIDLEGLGHPDQCHETVVRQ